MGSFTDFLEDKVLNHVFRNTAYTAAATMYVALFTVTPSDTGGGTEVSGHGYARQSIAFSAPSPSGTITNSADVLFPAATSAYGSDVVAFAVMDASTAGNMLAWGAVSPNVTININDQFKFAAGGVTVTLD